jgi:3-(3-hydroxy-phenyl)propionate hydroxylase
MSQDGNRILIAGAGPVGMITGLAMAQAGVPVTVFDSLPEVPADHRASTLHPSTLAMVAELGMADRLIEQGILSPVFQFRDRVAGRLVASFDYGNLADDPAVDVPFPFALQVEQHKTILTAYGIAKALPDFEILREHTVTDVTQNAGGVTATVETPDGALAEFAGRYLIGCDGGRSQVRKVLDIDFPGFTWEERFIIVSTHFDFEAADGFSYRNYLAHPERWSALIKVPGEENEGVWRSLFPAFGAAPDAEVLTDEWIQARYRECLPYDPPYEVLHRNLYMVHQRVAASFHEGRVLLAGDAAHVNNPVGGMGMNSGIHDGLNLADKLVRIWRGEADADIELPRYDRQRRPMAEKYVQAQSIRNKELLQETDMAVRQQRLDELTATSEDSARHRAFLRNAALYTMIEEANAIE